MDAGALVGLIGGSISIGQSVLEFLGFISKVAGADVASAYFSSDGTRLLGSEKIEVERLTAPAGHPAAHPAVWWFRVRELPDYVFTRIPVGGVAMEVLGTEYQDAIVDPYSVPAAADSRIWRWVPSVLPGRAQNNSHVFNAKVEFIVVGYKPKALVAHFSPKK